MDYSAGVAQELKVEARCALVVLRYFLAENRQDSADRKG